MKSVYYIKEDNAAVQDYYADVIGKGLEKAGFPRYKTISTNEIKHIDKNSVIICISHYLTVKMWIKGFKNLIYWVQGSSPDESFMRNRSYTRKLFISIIEHVALQKAKFVFMVSKGMLDHFKKKYNKDYSSKTYIMPCYNSEIQRPLFMTPGKYENNVFCYVGGLSKWQCFSETVALYKQIEDKLPNTMFKVFTGDENSAHRILSEYRIKNFEIKYVRPDALVGELASCKYGFIIRAKSPVNYVATPTKLSNYLAAGLIPIVSNSVSFFEEILGQTRNAVVLNGERDVEKILAVANKRIDVEVLYNEFNSLFDRFYNTDYHVNKIAQKINNFL